MDQELEAASHALDLCDLDDHTYVVEQLRGCLVDILPLADRKHPAIAVQRSLYCFNRPRASRTDRVSNTGEDHCLAEREFWKLLYFSYLTTLTLYYEDIRSDIQTQLLHD